MAVVVVIDDGNFLDDSIEDDLARERRGGFFDRCDTVPQDEW